MSELESGRSHSAVERDYVRQAEKLSLRPFNGHTDGHQDGNAILANFITPLDPVVETADGNRLPVVPIEEAEKLNALKDELEGRKPRGNRMRPRGLSRFDRINGRNETTKRSKNARGLISHDNLGEAVPPTRTHPLFPPLPLYGPPSLLRNLHCVLFRITSAFLSTCFLLVIVLGAIFTSIPTVTEYCWQWLTFSDPDKRRPFYDEERRQAATRREQETMWQERQKSGANGVNGAGVRRTTKQGYIPTEGGPDPLICDAQYYARRVGLDMEEFKVQTEDGFIITLWHVFAPAEYRGASQDERRPSAPEVFIEESPTGSTRSTVKCQYKDGSRRYPVLLMHGLLQSAGAYCVNDDASLAFFLAKSGYDVWLGNNRCGFSPEHSLLQNSDPRMWAWNIRQMGVMDLPALVSRVLDETGFSRLGLVCHSQGTTETFVALAKEQRPDLGDKISIFCALAPAVYAGPLIGKMYFKFMRVISPSMFRLFFGIHSFIPLMMFMHKILPGKLYGAMGYRVFSFLFNWTDTRWDRGLRDRFFLFSPVYVSSESMRWWLGRECFAKHRCVLSTKEAEALEDEEDNDDNDKNDDEKVRDQDATKAHDKQLEREESIASKQSAFDRARTAWYDEHAPPMALWIAGSDELVDGRRLLRRFERGREPNVEIVHTRVIEEYEHLDVIWAIDAIDKVGIEVRECIWRCMNEEERRRCRKPEGVDILLHGEEEGHGGDDYDCDDDDDDDDNNNNDNDDDDDD